MEVIVETESHNTTRDCTVDMGEQETPAYYTCECRTLMLIALDISCHTEFMSFIPIVS